MDAHDRSLGADGLLRLLEQMGGSLAPQLNFRSVDVSSIVTSHIGHIGC